MSFLGPLSSSNSQPINYISNGKATDSAEGWVTYSGLPTSQPESGLGGSANVTFTRNTTNPLSGNADFVFTKDAVNRQGQGASFGFILNESDVNKVLTVSFDYTVLSGTYSTGDLTVYLVQDPSAAGSGPVVTQPAGFQIQSITSGNATRHIATFQLSKGSFPYGDCRLCFHVASTSASAYSLAIDNVVLGPQVVQYGAPITDWQSYTPSTQGFGTPTNMNVYWRRVGGDIQVRGSFTAGTVTAAGARLNFPPGIVSTTDTVADTIIGTFGRGNSNNSKGGFILKQNGQAFVGFGPADTFSGTANASLSTQLATSVVISSEKLSFEFFCPIQGWSSTVQMSDDTDTRVVAAIYDRSNTQSLTGNVTDIGFPTLRKDTHSAWNGTQFTAPVSGFYCINGSIQLSVQVATLLSAYKNGLLDIVLNDNRGTDEIKHFSGTVFLNAGNTISVRSAQSVTIAPQGRSTYISIYRLSGPSAIAASETVAAGYLMTTSQAVTALVTPMNFSTKLYDSHGAVTTGASWNFTAPISGLYSISGYFLPAAQASAFLYKNSSGFQRIAFATASVSGAFSGTVSLLAGDSIDFRSTTTTTITGGTLAAGGSYVNITRVGNYV